MEKIPYDQYVRGSERIKLISDFEIACANNDVETVKTMLKLDKEIFDQYYTIGLYYSLIEKHDYITFLLIKDGNYDVDDIDEYEDEVDEILKRFNRQNNLKKILNG